MPETAQDRPQVQNHGGHQLPTPSDYLPPAGDGTNKPNGGRQDILARRILNLLEDQPGVLQKDVFRLVGEKDILVLSLLDQLVSDSLIERHGEPTCLYLIGEAPREPAKEGTEQAARRERRGRIDHRAENALILLDLYQLCHRKLGLRLEIGDGFRAYRGSQKVLAAAFGAQGSELTLYGVKDETLTQLRSASESSTCEVEEDELEGWVRIRGRSRSFLSGILSSFSASLSPPADGQKKAAER